MTSPLPSSSSVSKKHDYQHIFWEHVCKVGESTYANNPRDVDNLTRWGEAVMELSKNHADPDYSKMFEDALSKLTEALSINPKKYYTLICLGKLYAHHASRTLDRDVARVSFANAADYFDKARQDVDKDPELPAMIPFPPPYASSISKTFWEQICEIAEINYANYPRDADNLVKWGEALMELSKYQSDADYGKMFEDADSKLLLALSIDYQKYETFVCLGNLHTYNASRTQDQEEAELCSTRARIYFDKARQNRNKAFEWPTMFPSPLPSSSSVSKKRDGPLSFWEHEYKIAETTYANNPRDADNLTRWGEAVMELSKYYGDLHYRKMFEAAISKLMEARSINYKKYDNLVSLGKIYAYHASRTQNRDEAVVSSDKAAVYFDMARQVVDKDPELDRLMTSLLHCISSGSKGLDLSTMLYENQMAQKREEEKREEERDRKKRDLEKREEERDLEKRGEERDRKKRDLKRDREETF